jgi:hypothetical protein
MQNGALTLSEIESRYPSEWVLVENPETDDSLNILGGSVVFHSHDRDEVYRKAIDLPAPKYFTVVYTGRMPENTAIVV